MNNPRPEWWPDNWCCECNHSWPTTLVIENGPEAGLLMVPYTESCPNCGRDVELPRHMWGMRLPVGEFPGAKPDPARPLHNPLLPYAPHDAWEIFAMSEGFLAAAGAVDRAFGDGTPRVTLYSPVRGHWQQVVPQLVLHEFATELAFKCLYQLDGRKWGRIHDAKTLFRGLQQSTRIEVRRAYRKALEEDDEIRRIREVAPDHDLRLRAILSESREAFSRLRYAFEHRGDDLPANSSSLVGAAVRRVILARRPDWSGSVGGLPTFPAP